MKYIIDNYDKSICTLIINRPDQYNSLNTDVLIELENKLEVLEKNKEIRVIIITGSGNKSFIAGADIKEMENMSHRDAKIFSEYGQFVTNKIENYSKPIIAAINGYALGGGCEFAMACHLRYASENAIFGQPEVKLGLIAGWGGTQRLPKIIGKNNALELLLTAKTIDSKEALKLGLINKLFPSKDLISSVKKIAFDIADNAPLAILATIKSLNSSYDSSNNIGFNHESEKFASLFKTEDVKEGISAFKSKVKPKFKGK